MRYPDGGGLTASERARCERVRLAAAELIADDVVWHVQAGGPLDGDYHGRDQVFGFFGRPADETGGTFRLDVHDILANDEHTVVLATLTATRGGKANTNGAAAPS